MRTTYSLLTILLIFFVSESFSQKKNKSETNYLDKISLNGLKWRSVGPALTSGRVSDIAVNLKIHLSIM